MSNEEVIVAFLRKEPLCRGKIRSNGIKLFAEDTCISQWDNHHVLMNDTRYDESIELYQNLLYKWLKKSDLIYKILTDIPKGKQQILSYYVK